MLNQNDYSDSNQNREQNNRSNSGPTPNPYQPHQPPKRPTRRIGTLTMGVTLILVGIILLVFFFKPFDLFSLMRFSPVLLILLGIEIIWQYSRHHGEELRYDFWGTLFCLLVICVACFCSVFYPLYMEFGPASWKVEQQVSGEIFDELYQQIPSSLDVQALDVDCEIRSVTPARESMSAQELTSADRVVLYITLGNQTDKAGFAQQIRALFDSIDPEQYPNLSARVFADYEGGRYIAYLNDRFSMRLDVNGLLNLIEEDPDVEYAESDEYDKESYDEDTEISSEDAASEMTVGSSALA